MERASQYRVELDVSPETALESLAAAADLWGADWQPESGGGTLRLPVVRGLWRGVEQCRVAVRPTSSGPAVELSVEQSLLQVNRTAVMVLLFGGAGGLIVALWPFFPGLIPLLPVSVVLALVAWLLVVARLRTSDPGDFLRLVAEIEKPPPNANENKE